MVESEIAHGNAIELQNARESVLESIIDTGTEQAGIINAFGRTLAEPITADIDLNMHDIALVDGYALNSSDTKGATDKEPRSLGILTESACRKKKLQPSTAIVVHANDTVPEGADTIVPFDQAYRPDGGPQILLMSETQPAKNIQSAGTLPLENKVLIPQGTIIGPCEMSLLAHLGKPGISVRRKPRVAVITTGANVVEIVEDIEPGLARNRSRYEIVGMVMESGCELGRLVHVRDGRVGIEKAISDSLESEVIIVSLGMKDKHESAVNAIANLGDVRFSGIHLQPGFSTAFGVVEGRPVFVVSSTYALESFEAIIRPALLKMLVRARIDRHLVSATLCEPLSLSSGYTHYIRSNITYKDGFYETRPVVSPASQNKCVNSMIIVPPKVDSLKRGDKVNVSILKA